MRLSAPLADGDDDSKKNLIAGSKKLFGSKIENETIREKWSSYTPNTSY